MTDGWRMYVEGDESGEVSIVCTRPNCMRPGPTHQYNPEGLYLNPVLHMYHPTPEQVAQAWVTHEASHRTSARQADRKARAAKDEGVGAA